MLKTDLDPGYDGDMTPGTLLMPRSKILMGATAYNDSSMSQRSGFDLTHKDGPFLVIANLAAQETDVTYRPTLVLTGRGQLVWVVDFMLGKLVDAAA